MKTAGVVIDFYDDPAGAVLKEACPTPEDLPDFMKTAHILDMDERNVLRDEAYALLLSNEGTVLRKFACVDPGNTFLSCLYFEKNAEALPREAIEVAAQNLCAFCEDFGFEPTSFIKMAATGGMSRTRDSMKQPLIGDEADWAARTNLVSVRGGSDSGRVIPTANQMKTAAAKTDFLESWKKINPDWEKKRKAGKEKKSFHERPAGSDPAVGPGTEYFRNQDFPRKDPEGAKGKGSFDTFEDKKAKKAAATPIGGGETLTDDVRDQGPDKKNPKQQKLTDTFKDNNQMEPGPGTGDLAVNYKVQPQIVDVSSKIPIVTFQKKEAMFTAIHGRYSLDSYADVQRASRYFDENFAEMAPADRHDFAVKTAARADQLGIEVSELMERYGSTSYAPDVEAHLASRKASSEKEFHVLFDSLKEKRSSINPNVFVQLLEEADKAAGLHWYYGGDVTDPYLATFGGESEKKSLAAWDWQSRTGDRVTAEQLKKLSINGRGTMKKHFSNEIVDGFQKDPIAIFESLPYDHQVILSRLANDTEFSSLHGN